MTSNSLGHIWAKSARPGEDAGETLVAHTLSTLTTMKMLRTRQPGLAEIVKQPRIWEWMYWACALHDFGKCAAGFQRLLKTGERWDKRHEVLSLAFLPLVCSPDEKDAFAAIAAGIVSHHRDVDVIEKRYPVDREPTSGSIRGLVDEAAVEDIELLTQWILNLKRDAPDLGTVSVAPDVFARRFMSSAVDNISRALDEYSWLAQDLHAGHKDPRLLSALALRGLVISSDHIASAHRWAAITGPFRAHTAALVRPQTPFSHQEKAEQIDGSAMFIAPTGSGKTETAQLWAARQNAIRPVSHLYYVLPYQASMNAMKARLEKNQPHGPVALIHGQALEATYRNLLEVEYSPKEAARKARAALNLSRLQVHGARVLSPYQLLKAAFRVKGYEAILADLFDSALIYDEIHAYDPKRLALIICQMGDLERRFGARVCVMSATLPRFLQQWIQQEVPSIGDPIRASDAEFAAFCRHRVVVREGDLLDEANLPLVIERCRSGSVLMCCNTVARAQRVYDALRSNGIKPVLLHGRFTQGDRAKKESLLDPGQEQGLVMVATQVVEVSLNVSFSTIFTDPAPLEALFQRFGRVNRFRALGIVDVHVFTLPTDTGVYREELVQQSVEVLRAHNGQDVDEGQLGSWLDLQYTDDILGTIRADYERALKLTHAMLNALAPFQSDPDLRDEFFEMFDSVEVLPTSLVEGYQANLNNEEIIEANSLLVGIQWYQWQQLRRKGLAVEPKGDLPRLANVPYSEELGLQL